MDKRILTTSLVPALAAVIFLFGAGLANSQPRDERTGKQERPAQEDAEMRALRHKAHDLEVEGLRLAVRQGRLDEAEAAFRIKALESRKAFLDANPTWTRFGMRFGFGHGLAPRQGMGKPHRGAGQHGMRQDGRRDGKREGRREGQQAAAGKPARPERENAEMKDLRHKRHAAAVAGITLAAKEGRLSAEEAAFRVKAMESRKNFLDENPAWTRYGMGPGPDRDGRGRRGKGCGKRGHC